MSSSEPPRDLGLNSLVQKVGTKSALSPLIWIMGILLPATLISSAFDKDVTKTLLNLVVIDFGLICVGYVYFAFANPGMLRSEEHELAVRQLMGDDKNNNRVKIIEGALTANTHISETKAL